MTPDMLRRIGIALYGHEWKGAMARKLQVNERTVRRWAAGAYPVPKEISGTLSIACHGRASDLIQLGCEASRVS